MSGEWLYVAPQLLAAFLMLALAGWMCWLDFANRAVRAFSAYLVLVAGAKILIVAGQEGLVSTNITPILDVYFLWAIVALVALVIAVALPAARSWLLATVAIGVALGWLAIAFPCSVSCDVGARRAIGPLGALAFGFGLSRGVAAIALAILATRTDHTHRRNGWSLLAVILATSAVLDGAIFTMSLFREAGAIWNAYVPSTWATLGIISPTIGLVAAAVCAGILSRGSLLGTARVVLLVAAVAVGSGLGLVGGVVAAGPWSLASLGLAVIGVTLPLAAGFGLVRHRLFDLDARIKIVVGGGLVGGLLLATGFVVSQSLQQFLGAEVGPYLGIAVTGAGMVLVFPMQRRVMEFVNRAVGPATVPDGMTHTEKVRLYEDLAREAWADGVLSRKERRFLDQLRARLGLTFEETSIIESRAAQDTSFVNQGAIQS